MGGPACGLAKTALFPVSKSSRAGQNYHNFSARHSAPFSVCADGLTGLDRADIGAVHHVVDWPSGRSTQADLPGRRAERRSQAF
jgi:hypothetical protein